MDSTRAESQLAAQLTIGIVIKPPWLSVGVMLPRGLLNIFRRDRRSALRDAAGASYQVDCQEQIAKWQGKRLPGLACRARQDALQTSPWHAGRHATYFLLIATCLEKSSKLCHLGRKSFLLLRFPFTTFIYPFWFALWQAFEATAMVDVVLTPAKNICPGKCAISVYFQQSHLI